MEKKKSTRVSSMPVKDGDFKRHPEKFQGFLIDSFKDMTEKLREIADETEMDADVRLHLSTLIDEVFHKNFMEETSKVITSTFEAKNIADKMRQIAELAEATPQDKIASRPQTGEIPPYYEEKYLKNYTERLDYKVMKGAAEVERMKREIEEKRAAVNKKAEDLGFNL